MFFSIFLFPFVLFCVSTVASFPSIEISSEKVSALKASKYDFHSLKKAHKLEKQQQVLSAASEEEEQTETKVSEMKKSIKIAKEYETQLSKSLDKCDMKTLRKPITSLNAYQIAALSLGGIKELISGALGKTGINVDDDSVECASKAVADYKKVIVSKYELSEKHEQSSQSVKRLLQESDE